jgi:hypothetical protein
MNSRLVNLRIASFSLVFPLVLIYHQRLETGDHVEQFLVNAALTQAVECAVEIFQQFINVLVGAFHCGEAARVFARERFDACQKERDEKIFADESAQSHGVAAHGFGQRLRRPGNFDQTLLPCRIKRQQPLADRFVERAGLRAVVKNIKPDILTFGPTHFAFDLNLPPSGVMACTEFGTAKSPIGLKPASESLA